MQEYIICPICKQKFKQITKQHLDKHKISSKEFHEKFPNAKTRSESYNIKNKTTRNKLSKQQEHQKQLIYYENPKHCENCNSIISYEKRSNKFCDNENCKKISHSIGSKFVNGTKIIKCRICNTEKETNKRNRKSYICKNCRNLNKEIKKYEIKNKHKTTGPICNINYIKCIYCGQLTTKHGKNQHKYCFSCETGAKKKYWLDSQFKFGIKSFPKEFDFDLIKEYGWYSQKDNKDGVSRDHIISVMYGFYNNIPSNIISHPANCQLRKHKENQSKGYNKLIITYSELLERIHEWELKYGAVGVI